MRRTEGWLGLAAVATLGLGFRLFNIREQSLWFDEINSLVFPPEIGFAPFIERIRFTNPDHVPLYFVLNFAWAKGVSASIVGQRIFSVLLDVLSMAVLWRIALFSGRRGAAPIAVLLYALSSYHIFMSQAIRPYQLLIFLGLLSTWQVLRFLTRQTNWWMLLPLFLTYSALIWTHLSGLLLIAAHLSCLAVFALKSPRQLAIWTALGIALAGETVLALGFLRSVGAIAEPTNTTPGPWRLFTYLFCFDQPHVNDGLVPANYMFPGPLGPWTERLQPAVTWSLAAAFGLPTAYLAASALFGLSRRKQRDEPELRVTVLFLFCALLPVFAVAAITFLVTPLFMHRFAIASTCFFYLLFAVGVTRLRPVPACTVAGLLIALYAIQATSMARTHSRTEYLQACEIIRAGKQHGDLVISRESAKFTNTVPRIAGLYLPDCKPLNAVSIAQGIDFAQQFLSADVHASNSAWFLVRHAFDEPDLAELERIMADANLDYARTDFDAMLHLTLYRFQRARQPSALPGLSVREAVARRMDAREYADAVRAMGVAPDDPEWHNTVLAFAYAFDCRPVPPPESVGTQAQILLNLEATSMDTAYALAHRAVKLDPGNAAVQLVYGITSMIQGRGAAARAAFANCDGLIDFLSPAHPLVRLSDAMADGDCQRTQDELQRLRSIGNLDLGRRGWDRPQLLRECVQIACGSGDGKARR